MNNNIIDIRDYIFTVTKNKLYDVIWIGNYENILDIALRKMIDIMIEGGFPVIYVFLIEKEGFKEFTLGKTTNMDQELEIWTEKIKKEIQNSHIKSMIIGLTRYNPYINETACNILFITKKYTGVLDIPIKRIVHPSEGELYAINEESVNRMKVLVLPSQDVNFKLNLYEYLS